MTRKLIYWPDPRLKQPSRALDLTNPNDCALMEKLVPEMVEVMNVHGGVGLSAVQIGEPVALVVAKDRKEPSGYVWYPNPVIIHKQGAPVLMREGCLSAPGIFEEIRRHREVRVQFGRCMLGRTEGPRGFPGEEKIEERVSGRLAQVLQHECEHLVGGFFFDHLSGLRRARAYAKLTRTTPRPT